RAMDGRGLEVDYVIGSGTRGHSYLADRDGHLFQTPISWYSQKGAWGLSPGFDAERVRGRAIKPDCLYCHANRTRPVADTVNAYQKPPFAGHAIGCERCHGPGELHVKERTQRATAGGLIDHTIVHPGKLTPALRDSVCRQCHLAGEVRVLRPGRGINDFRPRLPPHPFP